MSSRTDMPGGLRGTTAVSISHVAQVVVATIWVVAVPLLITWALRGAGIVPSWVAVLVAVALALGASVVGEHFWQRHNTSDWTFSELLPWGWARRAHFERQLDRSLAQLRTVGPAGRANSEEPLVLLERLAQSLDSSDPYLAGHSRRVARYALATAKRMGLSEEAHDGVRTAALVHDVGKLKTPRELLLKPGALSESEFEQVKRHAAEGAEMVAVLGDELLTAAVRHHHERVDGSGYPDGLSGERIPLVARIIAVADTFDAVTSERPYRHAAHHRVAMEILREEADAQLDAAAVEAFRGYYSGRRTLALWMAGLAAPKRLFILPLLDIGSTIMSLGVVAALAAGTPVTGLF